MSTHNNILLVGNYKSDVGYAWWLMEDFWAAIARHYGLQGRRTVLIYPKVNEIPTLIQEAGIEIHEMDFGKDRTALDKLLEDAEIGSIYLTDRAYFSFYYRHLRRQSVRKIVLHDHTPGERPQARGIRRFVKQALYLDRIICCDLYVAVSEFVRRRMHDSGAIPPSKTTAVLNGIKPQGRNPAYRDYYRAHFCIPKEALVVGTTGRATFYKGIDFLIDCAADLINGHGMSDVYFLHCGDGPDLVDFRKMATERGLEQRFLFVGRRTDVREILQSCDIGIQASQGEAFSLSILEYMDAGLATLVPNVCGNGEAISHGITGLLFEPGDKEEVVSLLEHLITTPEKRWELGKAAETAVKQSFDIDRTKQELIHCLETIQF